MCRIYGHLGAAPSPAQLRSAAELMRGGGPDDQRCLIGDAWAMGSNRLAIMDPDGGRQPFVLDRIQVVYNGEIYNHRALREQLTLLGYHFEDHCDGSILPALYHRYGDRFSEHLDGMFAIAVLDLRAEPRLLLTTDDSGMKPLYYHWNRQAGTLGFASEIPALTQLPGVGRQRWLPGLDAYLTTRTPLGEQTMLANVSVLPRATTAVFTRAAGLRLASRPARTPAVDADLLRALREETHRLAEADAPLAVITSGGLDSGLVTALLAERSRPLHSFTIAYRGDWPLDERQFARQVADFCRTTHHQVEIDPAELPALLADTVRHLGQPNADPITVSTLVLFRAVRAAGFKVALTGDAADELFGGYDRIRSAMAAGSGADWVPGYLRAIAAVPAPLRTRLYSTDYRDHLRGSLSEHERLTRRLGAGEGERGGGERLAALTAFECEERLPAYHLRRVDHLSMAASVEARLPFCQPRIVGLAAGLAPESKVSGGRGKIALYQAARGLLPQAVLDRPKQPFTLPVTAMLVPGSALLEHAREVLAPAELRADGQLDPVAVGDLIEHQMEHPGDTTALAVWSLLVYQLWRTQADGFGRQLHGAPAFLGASA